MKKIISQTLTKASFTPILSRIFHINFIRQTQIFDVILKMFSVDFKKVENRILKMKERNQYVSAHEEEEIMRRLRRLGYIS